jgi:hypothetical protein
VVPSGENEMAVVPPTSWNVRVSVATEDGVAVVPDVGVVRDPAGAVVGVVAPGPPPAVVADRTVVAIDREVAVDDEPVVVDEAPSRSDVGVEEVEMDVDVEVEEEVSSELDGPGPRSPATTSAPSGDAAISSSTTDTPVHATATAAALPTSQRTT